MPDRSTLSNLILLLFTLYRSLGHIINMVGQRLAEIPRSVAARYWHEAALNLYGYLYYERL